MEQATLRFKQRNILARIELKLNADFLEYSLDSSGGKWLRAKYKGFNVRYDALPNAFDYRTFRSKDFLVLAPLLFTAAYTLQQLFVGVKHEVPFICAMLGIGAIYVAIGYALRLMLKKEYTVLATPAGNLLIVKDRQHDLVIAELQTRRLNALKKLIVLDAFQAPWTQLKKFKWLKDESIISEADFARYRSMILSSHVPVPEMRAPDVRPVLH